MNCIEFKELVAIYMYANLDNSQKQQIDKHTKDCSKCRLTYIEIEKSIQQMESKTEIKLPDWEKSWDVIKEKSLKKNDPVIIKFSLNKFIAAAAAIVIIALASVSSIDLFKSGNSNTLLETDSGNTRESSIQSYSEKMDLIFLSYMNRPKNDGSKEFQDIKKMENEILSDMLIQTKALIYIASEREDQKLQDLLEGIEIALIGMKNNNSIDQEVNKQLDQFVRESTQKLSSHLISNTNFVYETRR